MDKFSEVKNLLPRPIVKFPDYQGETQRLSTFNSWSIQVPSSESLASAGFFYVGRGDYVKCFFCGLGLSHWEPDDDPLQEHMRWSPDCRYVKEMRINENKRSVTKDQSKFKDSQNSASMKYYVCDSLLETDLEMDTLPLSSPEEIPKDVTPTPPLEQLGASPPDPNHPLQTQAAQNLIDKGHIPKDVQKAINRILDSNATNGNNLTADSLTENDILNELNQKEDSDSSQGAIGGCKEQEEEPLACKVCCRNTVSIVFLPCGHLVCCAMCSPAMPNCPICRGNIKGTVKVHI